MFESDEWCGACLLLKKPIPSKPGQLNTVLRMSATLGGFLGRKCDGETDIKMIWIGLQRVAYFCIGMNYARHIQAL